MLSHSDADRAKQADIGEVASRYTTLKRATSIEYAGPCPVCGGRDRFGVNIRRGLWNCRGCGKGGDVIALAQHVEGLSFRDAVERLTGEQTTPSKPRPRPVAGPTPREDDGDKQSLRIAALIAGGIIPLRSTPGASYLSDVRKIDAGAIAAVLESTAAIGWNPSVLFREPGHDLDGKRLGAIIGIMTDPLSAEPTGGISRTYLHEGHKVGKAKNLGPAGIVRLTPDEDVSHGLFLAEGLETALAAMSKGLRPAWSTGSTSIMAKMPVLGGVESITILADHDENGAGERAAREAERRWEDAGREVRVWIPPTRGDLNDILMKGARHDL
jgi:CHC2 zinc finger/Toprim domain